MNPPFSSGEAALNAITGSTGRAVVEALAGRSPALASWIVDFAYGQVLSRPGLDLRSRELTTIAALAALGTCGPQLKVHIQGCLNTGCTRDEVLEVFAQLAVYAGFPAALNAVAAAWEVWGDRDQ